MTTERPDARNHGASTHQSDTHATPRCVACVQPRRGHGVTVTTYYLARALAARGVRPLVADLTGRRARLQALAAAAPMPGLTLWTPHIPQPEHLGGALARARSQAAGKLDVILLDMDAPYLQRAGGVESGVDYTLIFIEHSDMGMREADSLAERLNDVPPPRGKVAAVFTRVSAASMDDLPQRTAERGLPVLGESPADYRLAAGDDYSLTGAAPAEPHDTYLGAVGRLARTLTQMVGITSTRGYQPPPATREERASQ